MLKLLSLFSGIGAFEKALENIGVHYELVAFCEFDKYAVKSYCAIHGVDESKNLGDITQVDETKLAKDIDVLTYGFPCQDISLAGKQKGLMHCAECDTDNEIPKDYVKRVKNGEKFYCKKCGSELSLTRSGLFFEALRIIEATKPKVAIAENVKNLTSKKFAEQFKIVLDSLEEAGYNNYWAVLNAKDFGIPQNRERVFIVSIRKDIDTGLFEFPEPFPLEKRLKDILEEVVDEKYYLSDKMMEYLFTITEKNKARGNGNVYAPTDPDGVSKTITTKEGSRVKDNSIEEPQIAKCVGGIGEKKSNGGQQWYQQDRVYQGDIALAHPASIPGGSYHYVVGEPQLHQVGQLYGTEREPNPQAGRVYDVDGISPTMDTCSGGNRMPKVLVREAEEKWGSMKAFEPRTDGVANTLSTVQKDNYVAELPLRIRKLTPKECFRLMGFDDESFHRAEAVNSNTQLYKQAGNSIVVDVLEELFCMMLDEDGNLYV